MIFEPGVSRTGVDFMMMKSEDRVAHNAMVAEFLISALRSFRVK